MTKEAFIQTFLYFGYIPTCNTEELDTLPWNTAKIDPVLSSQPVDVQADVLGGAFRHAFQDCPTGDHVVPLSGGLDSRAILAELVRHVDTANISAVTFGVPGAFDFDIAKKVARHFGVRHFLVDLNQIPLTRAKLVEVARSNKKATWLMDAYYNRLIRQLFGRTSTFWSGVLGSLTMLPTYRSETWSEAIERFMMNSAASASSIPMAYNYNMRELMPSQPIHPDSDLSYDEQIYMTLRSFNLVEQVNLPDGFRNVCPFRNPAWLRTLLSLDPRICNRKTVYRMMLERCYPNVFNIPSKSLAAGSLNKSVSARTRQIISGTKRRLKRLSGLEKVRPAVNYIDWDKAVVYRSDVVKLIRDCVGCLVDQGVIESDIRDRLLVENDSRRLVKHRGHKLLVLASLQIYLSQWNLVSSRYTFRDRC